MRWDKIVVCIIFAVIFSIVFFYPKSVYPLAAGERCPLGICDGKRAKTYDARGLRMGDIYSPGHGRRLQIRDKNLKILGYIERSGKITDTQRRKLGEVK